jgi:5'-methylthioadenosine phosphorylase
MTSVPTLAFIGGSGIYSIPGLTNAEEHELLTPFGKPSAPVLTGVLENKKIAFLARHGLDHQISPSEVNYRANIYALKSLGVEQIVSISAAGSLREDYKPGEMAIPDQLFDFTRDRKRSFFGEGLVAHSSVADPFCPLLSAELAKAVKETEVKVHKGGVFITIEGPRFSTRAESNVYRSWGMSLIGMTTSPEAFLAREAEICYAVLVHITDYDVWHLTEEAVSVEMVIDVLNRNVEAARQVIQNLVHNQAETVDCECRHAMKNALITNKKRIPAETAEKLDLLIGKYL